MKPCEHKGWMELEAHDVIRRFDVGYHVGYESLYVKEKRPGLPISDKSIGKVLGKALGEKITKFRMFRKITTESLPLP